MSDYRRAVNLIKKYEGYSEKAYPDTVTGSTPYTFGYGTQYYPNGAPVKQGQCCTKQKALEYLTHEVLLISNQLDELNLDINDSMRNSLTSFVHSIGWEPFLYSNIIDFIEEKNYVDAAEEITHWIFDPYYKVIGGLVDRRREEAHLFLAETKHIVFGFGEILLNAFRNYSAEPRQIQAIKTLENNISPYVLSEFANSFDYDQESEDELEYGEADTIFTSWD